MVEEEAEVPTTRRSMETRADVVVEVEEEEEEVGDIMTGMTEGEEVLVTTVTEGMTCTLCW